MLRVMQRYFCALATFVGIVAFSLAITAYAAQIYGSGGFQPGNLGGGVGSPYAAAVGDFNNDGHLDVAVIKNNNNDSGSVAIYTRNAIGTLTLTHDYGIFNLVNPREILAVDLNGDGKLDLVITDDAGVAVLLGTGDPTASFVSPALGVRAPINSESGTGGARSTVVLDINHDGIPDLFTFIKNLDGDYVIQLSMGVGGGQFVNTLSLGGYAPIFAAVKVDGDNEPDLVTADGALQKIFFQKGLGSGFFLPASFTLNYGATVGPLGELRMIDLDGDGKVDMVMANIGGTGVWMAKGNGDGTFNTPALLFSSGVQYDPSRQMGQMVIADINNDGRLDIVTDGYVAVQQANHSFVYNEHIGGNYIFGDPISAYPSTRMLAGVKNAAGLVDLITGGPPPSDTNIVVYRPVPGTASNVYATGTPQSTPFNTAFANPLTITVKDNNNLGVSGLQVLFSTSPGVATATLFAGTTDAQGKVSYTPAANGGLGCYQLTATIATVAVTPTFDLCNTGANTLTVLPASNNQTTLVNTAFGNVLQVQLKNSSNVAVSGVTVSFSKPANGASATLAPTSGVTDGSGVIFVNATANGVAGAYQLLVSAPGTTPTIIKLNNSAPANAAAALAVDVNTPQYGYVTKPFTGPIIIHVTDFFNNPVPGVTVKFALTPDLATGATATFSALTAVTNAQGNAQVTATANGFVGQYSMKVTLPNNPFAAPKSFALKNIASLPKFMALTSGTPQSTPVLTAFTQKLRVKVTDSLNAVTPQVRVFFSISNNAGANATLSPSSALADASGFAEVTATANGIIGSYQVGAIVFDTSSELPITQLFNLTNLAAVIPDFVLTVTKSGSGTGTVTGTGITCGADCTETLAQNTVVLLTAASTAGSTFVGWTGAGCSGTGTCSVTMDAAKTVNAQFDVIVVPTFLLTVTKSGSGTGNVTGTGIACGADCTETLAQNTVVSLAAAPIAGSTFVGWTGAGCSGNGTCGVTMSAAQTVNAQFDVIPAATFLLTATKSGTGSGTVTATGIACGVDCNEIYAQNTLVTLTASSAAGSTFAGWSGAGCSGTGSCIVTMSAAQTVNAQFDVVIPPPPPPPVATVAVPTLHPALLALLTLLMAGAMLLTTARRWR